ncbi:hypothetical protein F5Y18DRAFT_371480 [Xylariaceae sp. FL1019]|nr:hypothetical protein F5Y18DRAFT_371480 [Xylariaceae sp. FL1019]
MLQSTQAKLLAWVLLCSATCSAVFIPEQSMIERRAFSNFRTATTGNGVCDSGQAAQLKVWIDDTVKLAQAAIDALASLETATKPYEGQGQIEYTARTADRLLGVDWQSGTTAEYTAAKQYFEGAKALANTGVVGARPAWIFCGDAFTERKQWSDMAYDIYGRDVPNPNKNNQPMLLSEVGDFNGWRTRNTVPYWIPAMQRYAFSRPGVLDPGVQGKQAGAICTNADKNPLAVTSYNVNSWPIITICSPTNKSPPGDAFTAFPHDNITEVPLVTGSSLDRHRPGSATMLHEFMHATRPRGATHDRANNALACANAADRTIPRDAPECAALFAVAMWLQADSAKKGNPHHFWSTHAVKV